MEILLMKSKLRKQELMKKSFENFSDTIYVKRHKNQLNLPAPGRAILF